MINNIKSIIVNILLIILIIHSYIPGVNNILIFLALIQIIAIILIFLVLWAVTHDDIKKEIDSKQLIDFYISANKISKKLKFTIILGLPVTILSIYYGLWLMTLACILGDIAIYATSELSKNESNNK